MKKDFQEEMRSIWPKIIQISKNEVYIIAGRTDDDETTTDCFKYLINENLMKKIHPIQKSRSAFGLVYLRNSIYVIGGLG